MKKELERAIELIRQHCSRTVGPVLFNKNGCVFLDGISMDSDALASRILEGTERRCHVELAAAAKEQWVSWTGRIRSALAASEAALADGGG